MDKKKSFAEQKKLKYYPLITQINANKKEIIRIIYPVRHDSGLDDKKINLLAKISDIPVYRQAGADKKYKSYPLITLITPIKIFVKISEIRGQNISENTSPEVRFGVSAIRGPKKFLSANYAD